MSKIADIQQILEVTPDGVWGPKSRLALELLVNPATQPQSAAAPAPLDPHRALQWPLERDAASFYGRSDGSEEWEARHLVFIPPPYPMNMDGKPILRIRCHRLVGDSLARCLQQIKGAFPTDEARRAAGLDRFDGCYNFRKVRGAVAKLSMHAYGAAIDFDAADNALGQSRGYRMPRATVDIFKAEGWRWGGDYKGRKDPMHFEACR